MEISLYHFEPFTEFDKLATDRRSSEDRNGPVWRFNRYFGVLNRILSCGTGVL